jgi:mannose-6-phosphate isomerase-like protein (cupin superfamily)
LWIGDGQRAEEVRLFPGRAVRIPAFAVFQYRSDPGENLIVLLAAVPQWQPNLAHRADRQHWSPSAPGAEEDRSAPAHVPGEPMVVRDLRVMADHAALDGSQIRLLVSTAAGGMAYCLLPQGQRTRPVRHKTVSEVWYVLDGHGELARWDTDTVPTVLALSAGTSISIPPRTPFQFRTTGLDPLRLMLLTMPAWPGAAEAETAPRRLDPWSHLP